MNHPVAAGLPVSPAHCGADAMSDDDDREAGVRVANRMLVKAGVDATIKDVGSRYRLTHDGETYDFAELGRLLQWVYEHCNHTLNE